MKGNKKLASLAAGLILAAIVLGIVVIFELPNRMFHWLARRK